MGFTAYITNIFHSFTVNTTSKVFTLPFIGLFCDAIELRNLPATLLMDRWLKQRGMVCLLFLGGRGMISQKIRHQAILGRNTLIRRAKIFNCIQFQWQITLRINMTRFSWMDWFLTGWPLSKWSESPWASSTIARLVTNEMENNTINCGRRLLPRVEPHKKIENVEVYIGVVCLCQSHM